MENAPRTPRFKIEQTAQNLRISIPARRHWALLSIFIILCAIWLCGDLISLLMTAGYFVGLVSAGIGQNTVYEVLFVAVWDAGWLGLGGWLFVKTLLTPLVRREVIEVNSELLSISQRLLVDRPGKMYLVEKVKQFKQSTLITTSSYGFIKVGSQWARKDGSLEFEYDGQKVHCGVGLDEAEGREAAEKIVHFLKLRD
jgi:hypothetical protein